MKKITKNVLIVAIAMLAVVMAGCNGPAKAPNLDPAPTIVVDMVTVEAPVVVPTDATPDAAPVAVDAAPDAASGD
jgi:hypothetical protein